MGLGIQQKSSMDEANLAEIGRAEDGSRVSLDRRLFMQFMAFGNARGTQTYTESLDQAGLSGVLYEDINDPHGLGLLTYSENPNDFLDRLRPVLRARPFSELKPKPEFTMLGRTYALGHEQDLLGVLITRPIGRLTNPELRWAIWYPVRRSGAFEDLSAEEQRVILMEHGGIGRSFGMQAWHTT